jgi:ABC-type glycerol-3-phosphate transport system substrate-binding protein
MTKKSVFRHPFTRRRFVGTGLAAGAAAASTTFAVPTILDAARQDAAVSGELVEWGFGIQETNPLARARVLAFQEAFPDVELEIVETFEVQNLLTGAASGNLPDVIWLSRGETATWAATGVLAPLTEFIERDSYDTSVFYPFAIEETTYEGEIYGIPGGADVRGLYVNLDHLEEIGVALEDLDTSDWDQLSEVGSQLAKVSGDQVERWGLDHKVQAGNLWQWGYGNGGSFLSEDGTEATFNDEKNVEALQWAVDAYEAQGGSKLYDAFATTFQGDQQFAEGKVSMSIYEQWMLSAAIATVAPDMNFRLLPLRERGSGPDGPIATWSGGNGWFITTGAKNPDAAWEYIKFMHTDETWRFARSRAIPTSRRSPASQRLTRCRSTSSTSRSAKHSTLRSSCCLSSSKAASSASCTARRSVANSIRSSSTTASSPPSAAAYRRRMRSTRPTRTRKTQSTTSRSVFMNQAGGSDGADTLEGPPPEPETPRADIRGLAENSPPTG